MSPETTHSFRVRYNECDQVGIVFNANFLIYADVAANEFWREHLGGYSTLKDLGLDVVLAEANIRFRRPLHFDEDFEVRVGVGTITSRSMEMEFGFTRDGEAVADITIAYVCIDTSSQEPRPIPEGIRSVLEGQGSESAI
ncbi:MAG: acyl-CoA thioesterase [Solirubrobacterales bacterium]|nr:acyl-CoA thioesterase [Solirubrobacterales bacterium]